MNSIKPLAAPSLSCTVSGVSVCWRGEGLAGVDGATGSGKGLMLCSASSAASNVRSALLWAPGVTKGVVVVVERARAKGACA